VAERDDLEDAEEGDLEGEAGEPMDDDREVAVDEPHDNEDDWDEAESEDAMSEEAESEKAESEDAESEDAESEAAESEAEAVEEQTSGNGRARRRRPVATRSTRRR
jgi:hypothetical protein